MRFLHCMLLVHWLIGSALTGGDWEELPKFGALLQHYQEHSQGQWDWHSMASFIDAHYFNSEASDEDPSHERLPFFHHTSPAPLAVLSETIVLFHFDEPRAQHRPVIQSWTPVSNPSLIFQPPQA